MTIERWGLFEIATRGVPQGDPYLEPGVFGAFEHDGVTRIVPGFCDGDDRFVVRFMPDAEGEYRYRVYGEGFDTLTGTFTAVAPTGNNHGPVRAEGTKLVYADGTPYLSVGTTCYAWTHQSKELQEQTLDTLAHSCFNKMRMCVFPKYYRFNRHEPITYPYVRGKAVGIDESKRSLLPALVPEEGVLDVRDFDCTRFDPIHFQNLDLRIARLCEMGIEADLILFHPYDKWGFSIMTPECNERYLRYMAARYGAYRNVWWSMANEWDLTDKGPDEWERYGRLITNEDPYRHLCSVHNCYTFYDYRQDWITHCSMQRNNRYLHIQRTDEFMAEYGKPVVWDEICYEGDIDMDWGNISPQEMVFRFWEATLRGGYPGHGETYDCPSGILWWSHGGTLKGESEARFKFLLKIWEDVPGRVLKRVPGRMDELISIPEGCDRPEAKLPADYELRYFGISRPKWRMIALGEGRYRIEVIDTYNMTITDTGVHTGVVRIDLPGHEYIAVRIRRVM